MVSESGEAAPPSDHAPVAMEVDPPNDTGAPTPTLTGPTSGQPTTEPAPRISLEGFGYQRTQDEEHARTHGATLVTKIQPNVDILIIGPYHRRMREPVPEGDATAAVARIWGTGTWLGAPF